MECRRSFLKKGLVGVAALSVPAVFGCSRGRIRPQADVMPRPVRKACVLWYSQTGFTRQSGEAMVRALGEKGIEVVSGDLRDVEKSVVSGADLVVVGSPVFYYDTPDYVKDWIDALPDLKGIPVAAYVTFGGPEGNQHNAGFSILEHLTGRGGRAVGMASFLTMSTFPLSWPKDKATVEHKLAEIRASQSQVRQYALNLVSRVQSGHSADYRRKLTLREIATGFNPIWWTKRAIKRHTIDAHKCIQCGTCAEKCPVGAIDPARARVDTAACVLCFACINNCPAQAVQMVSGDGPLMGYRDFMAGHHLSPDIARAFQQAPPPQPWLA